MEITLEVGPELAAFLDNALFCLLLAAMAMLFTYVLTRRRR